MYANLSFEALLSQSSISQTTLAKAEGLQWSRRCCISLTTRDWSTRWQHPFGFSAASSSCALPSSSRTMSAECRRSCHTSLKLSLLSHHHHCIHSSCNNNISHMNLVVLQRLRDCYHHLRRHVHVRPEPLSILCSRPHACAEALAMPSCERLRCVIIADERINVTVI